MEIKLRTLLFLFNNFVNFKLTLISAYLFVIKETNSEIFLALQAIFFFALRHFWQTSSLTNNIMTTN